MQLAGKAALISGAGGGICRAIALAFAEAGASVCCVDIDPEAAAETARLVTEIGGRSVVAGLRRCRRGRRRSPLPARRTDAFGRLDILVSGAAPHDPSGTVLETSLGRLAARARREPDRLVSAEPRRSAVDDRRGRRLDHLHRLAARPGRQRRARRLLRDKGRADPARQGHGDRSRGADTSGSIRCRRAASKRSGR